MSLIKRDKQRANARLLNQKYRFRYTHCPNCKQKFAPNETGHFIPPSLGETGFFICKKASNVPSSR